MTANRIYDENGWFEVPDNPILRAGIFEYQGANLPGAPDPDKIYRVWRPEEQIADPECIASFRLIPWIDDHPPGLLGEEDMGYTAPEDKGIHGTIGERVYFRDGVLRGNIKLFSSTLAALVADGKKELSPGYRAKYDYTPGIADRGIAKGKPYDVIQLRPRGNHLASVDEGRQGPSVAVLDGITLDAKDIIKMADENTVENTDATNDDNSGGTTVSLEEGIKIFLTMLPVLQKLVSATNATASEDVPPPSENSASGDKTLPEQNTSDNADTLDNDDQGQETNDNDDSATLDAIDKRVRGLEGRDFKSFMREMRQRDILAESLSWHIGTFDCKDMTTSEVAAYGLKKLKITAPKGQEMACLNGYLQGAANVERPLAKADATLDSVDETGVIGKYLKGE